MNRWTSHLFVGGCILVSLCPHAWAVGLPLGQTQTGTIASAAGFNTYTFSANANDVVDFTLVTTEGTLVPRIQLYNPNGTLISSNYSNAPYACGGSTVEMNTVQLVSTGTYTVDVSDCSSTNTGNYALYAQRTNNPAGAVDAPFGQPEAGSISSAAQSSTYTFSANANDEVDFTLVTTSGTLVPKVRLYNPSGTLLSSNYSNAPYACGGSTLEMNTIKLPTTGTYTVLVGDCGDTNTGNYEIFVQLTDSPAGPAGILFGQAQTGSISAAAQSNAYTFTANANDVVDFTMVTTNGGLVPKMRLYNPDGTLNSSNYSNSPYACGGSTLEMNTVKLPSSGTYSLLVGDCGDKNTGNYVIYTQRTSNPAGAATLPFAQTQTGLVGSAAQSDTYTLSANANDVVDFTMVTTNGSLVPKMRLYNPDGTLLSSNYSNSPYACGGSTLEMNTVKLPSSGTYTLLVGDCGDKNTGNYVIYAQRTNNPAQPTGILSGQVESGAIASAAQSNTYTFLGGPSAVVDFTMVTTSGTLVPKIRLYNPDGSLLSSNYSNSPYACGGSTVALNSVMLTQSGTYTVLVGDCGDTKTGNYNLSSQCFGCPVANGPSITSVTPTSVLAGSAATPLTIAGSNFVANATVSFNGTTLAAAAVSVDSTTAITATIPVNLLTNPAASVPIIVTNPDGTPSNTWTSFQIQASLGANCVTSLSGSGEAFSANGGTDAITVTAPSACSWSVSGAPNWIIFISPASGTGDGTVTFQIPSNTGSSRSVTLTIGGLTFTFEQATGVTSGFSFIGSMAQLASGGGWDTTLTLVNTGAASGEALMNLFADDGTPLQLPFTFPQTAAAPSSLVGSTLDQTLNPNSILVLDTQQPSNPISQTGSAQLSANGAINGFAIFHYIPTGQEAVVPLETRNAPSYILAFDNTSNISTGVALANISPNPATVPLVIRDDTGALLGTFGINLPATGHTSFLLATDYSVTTGIRGTVEFDTPSGGQIAVLGLRASPISSNANFADTTIPVMANVAAGAGSMAQLAAGGGWQTTFTLVNTGGAPAQAQLAFYDNDGVPLPLPLLFPQSGDNTTASSLTQMLAPGATLIVTTNLTTGSAVGSAQFATTGTIGTFAIFQYTPTGQEAVVPLETRNPNAFVLAFDDTGSVSTGLALANLSNVAQNVPVIIRDNTGSTIGTDIISLAPNGHTSFMLNAHYSFTVGVRGTVEFDTPSGGQISVLGLRASPISSSTNFAVTSLPVLVK